jgi:hypothetical protein
MRKFLLNLLDGMSHIRLFPDSRPIDEILKDYDNEIEMKFMLIGFVLILSGILGGFFLIMKDHDVAGSVVSIVTLLVWTYAQFRKRK